MKITIVGNGNVGMALFANLINYEQIKELQLVGRDLEKMNGEINDYRDAIVLSPNRCPKLSSGSYDKMAGSDIIIYTAGVGQKPGQDRLDLIKTNAQIAKSIFEPVKDLIKNSIIICVANPVDVLTSYIQKITQLPQNQVIGSGTLLETARLKRYISDMFEINPSSIEALVIGEHGLSATVLWDALRIANFDIDSYARLTISSKVNMKKTIMENYMKSVAYKLIEKKGNTAYGVANATCKVVSAIIHDTREILPVSTTTLDKYDQLGSCVSVPCIIGSSGVVDTLVVKMNDEERESFNNSAGLVRDVIDSL